MTELCYSSPISKEEIPLNGSTSLVTAWIYKSSQLIPKELTSMTIGSGTALCWHSTVNMQTNLHKKELWQNSSPESKWREVNLTTTSVGSKHWYVMQDLPSMTNWCLTSSLQDWHSICTRSCTAFNHHSSPMNNGGSQLSSNKRSLSISKDDKMCSKEDWMHLKQVTPSWTNKGGGDCLEPQRIPRQWICPWEGHMHN